MEWGEAMQVLERWEGRRVVVVAYLEPGISLEPAATDLRLHRDGAVVRLDVPGLPAALRRSTFLGAQWVPGREGRALSVVQGGLRVDVLLDDDGAE